MLYGNKTKLTSVVVAVLLAFLRPLGLAVRPVRRKDKWLELAEPARVAYAATRVPLRVAVRQKLEVKSLVVPLVLAWLLRPVLVAAVPLAPVRRRLECVRLALATAMAEAVVACPLVEQIRFLGRILTLPFLARLARVFARLVLAAVQDEVLKGD